MCPWRAGPAGERHTRPPKAPEGGLSLTCSEWRAGSRSPTKAPTAPWDWTALHSSPCGRTSQKQLPTAAAPHRMDAAVSRTHQIRQPAQTGTPGREPRASCGRLFWEVAGVPTGGSWWSGAFSTGSTGHVGVFPQLPTPCITESQASASRTTQLNWGWGTHVHEPGRRLDRGCGSWNPGFSCTTADREAEGLALTGRTSQRRHPALRAPSGHIFKSPL